MWLVEQMARQEGRDPVRSGRVVLSSQEGLGVVGESEYRQLPLFAPGGLRFYPAEGEQLLLAQLDGQTICLGAAFSPTGLAPGELELGCGGGYLRIRQDGGVEINGMLITKEGELIPKEGAGGL